MRRQLLLGLITFGLLVFIMLLSLAPALASNHRGSTVHIGQAAMVVGMPKAKAAQPCRRWLTASRRRCG
ncbi:MAG: hypothetical protein EBR79_01360 [Proteobacteria bacterium]|nr:hypothetical protein [Pseudomonadota bacterium]